MESMSPQSPLGSRWRSKKCSQEVERMKLAVAVAMRSSRGSGGYGDGMEAGTRAGGGGDVAGDGELAGTQAGGGGDRAGG
mmetsp:Transcript_976/g.2134  ORF Transcript_976/g.2134 Transcript_976/m.2134 type:complete len:80 (+) Transcript_976:1097-1336(+)